MVEPPLLSSNFSPPTFIGLHLPMPTPSSKASTSFTHTTFDSFTQTTIVKCRLIATFVWINTSNSPNPYILSTTIVDVAPKTYNPSIVSVLEVYNPSIDGLPLSTIVMPIVITIVTKLCLPSIATLKPCIPCTIEAPSSTSK